MNLSKSQTCIHHIMHLLFYFVRQKLPNAKIGFSKAMSAGWLSVDKNAEGGTRVLRKVPTSAWSSVKRCVSAASFDPAIFLWYVCT